MDHATVNTILMVIIIPVMGWVALTTMGTKKTMVELKTFLMGYEDQGGLARRVEGIGDRTHRLEQAATVLLAEHHMKLEDFRERRGP